MFNKSIISIYKYGAGKRFKFYRRMLFIVLINVVFVASVIGRPFKYFEINAYHWNSVFERFNEFQINFQYDEESDKVYIFIPEFIALVSYELDSIDRKAILETIDKYIEWEKKAIEMEVEIEKRIDSIYFKGWFRIGDNWEYSYRKSCGIEFSFFSQSLSRHQLVLSFESIVSSKNRYITHKPEQVYLEFNNVIGLRNALSKKIIKEAIKEEIKQKKIEDAFN